MVKDCRLCPFVSSAIERLDNCQMEQLTDNHIVVGFKKGDAIIKQGTYSTNVIFLRKGLVKVHITGPYNEQIVKISKAPQYLGLPTTFGDAVNQYSITALESCELCFIDITTFRNLLKESEVFSYEIIQALCRYEIESFRRCANRTQKLTRGNMADVLLDFANRFYESDTFTLPISQTEIGNLVDTSRESVSRILSEFERDGIIKMEGKQIEITNKKSLELISLNG